MRAKLFVNLIYDQTGHRITPAALRKHARLKRVGTLIIDEYGNERWDFDPLRDIQPLLPYLGKPGPKKLPFNG